MDLTTINSEWKLPSYPYTPFYDTPTYKAHPDYRISQQHYVTQSADLSDSLRALNLSAPRAEWLPFGLLERQKLLLQDHGRRLNDMGSMIRRKWRETNPLWVVELELHEPSGRRYRYLNNHFILFHERDRIEGGSR